MKTPALESVFDKLTGLRPGALQVFLQNSSRRLHLEFFFYYYYFLFFLSPGELIETSFFLFLNMNIMNFEFGKLYFEKETT